MNITQTPRSAETPARRPSASGRAKYLSRPCRIRARWPSPCVRRGGLERVLDLYPGRMGPPFADLREVATYRRPDTVSKKSRRARLEQGENDASPCLRPSVVLNRDGVDHRAAGRRRAAVLGVQLREQQRARPARCPEDLVPTQGQPGAGSAGDRALPEPVRGSAARQRRPGAGLRQPLRRRAPQGGRWRQDLRAGQQPGAAKPQRRQAGGPGATLFRGETLRGLLLNAYAFWKVGQIALVASIASFALAGVMLLLTVLGFWHLRRVGPTEELMAPTNSQRTGAPA